MKCNCNGPTCGIMIIGIFDRTIENVNTKCLECGATWREDGGEE
tara:strand:+ start:281 stop:412 length:132 start_codon:yes stop_codon:yes gene_type:complete